MKKLPLPDTVKLPLGSGKGQEILSSLKRKSLLAPDIRLSESRLTLSSRGLPDSRREIICLDTGNFSYKSSRDGPRQYRRPLPIEPFSDFLILF